MYVPGKTYLVHVISWNGVLTADDLSRPLLIEEAGEALKYLEGQSQNRPQGVLYGLGGFTRDGVGVSRPNAVVHLEGAPGHFQSKILSGRFEIVAPPGEYEVWLETGNSPMARNAVQLKKGQAVYYQFDAAGKGKGAVAPH